MMKNNELKGRSVHVNSIFEPLIEVEAGLETTFASSSMTYSEIRNSKKKKE